MDKSIIEVDRHFWNIRGSFRVAGLLDLGTQASLVRLGSGKFVLLDAYSFPRAAQADIHILTGGAEQLEAILNLHPFHTMHVEALHERYPHARLYGTERHHARFPALPWQPERSESPALHRLYRDDFAFSVPRGVDFISVDEHIHFASVLAYHRHSNTIHSDDTFNHVRAARLLAPLGLASPVSLHPTLARALQPRAGAAAEFRAWANTLISEWGHCQNLCAAHTGPWLGRDHPGASLKALLTEALARAEGTLATHERKHG
jgi:hypothetical protein